MAYTKHNWVNGETITDTLLNHMEDGIDNNSPLVVFFTEDDNDVYTMDKTWNEIYNAMASGKPVITRHTYAIPADPTEVNVYCDYLIGFITPALPPTDDYYHIFIDVISGEGDSVSLNTMDFKCADPDSNPTYSDIE